MVPVVLAWFEVTRRSSLENRMSEQIYPVSGTVNKFPSPGPSPEEMGQSS